MNYSEICEALEEEYKTIGFLRSTGQYKAAANNIRQVLEMICEYYGELYQISDFKSDRYKLFEKIKFLHKNNRIDKKTKEAFFNLKNLGNRGSHYKINEDVSQLQIDRALPILRAEIDKFIEKTKPVHSINNNNVLFPFKTLSEEGWYGKQKIKSEFQLYNAEGDDSPYYVENVIYTLPNKIAPKFLYDYVVQNKLHLIAWDLDKRVIKQDRNEYFCHVNIPVFDKTGDILYVVAHFVKDNDSNEVIVFDIECNNQIFYHYDKYKRQLSGIWCDKKDEIEKSIRIINLGNGLSDLQEDSLVLAFHYGLPQYAIYKVKNVCCIDDENNDMAIALSQSGDLLYEKENISDNVKIVVGDIYRLHCLNNCLKKYLKTDVKLDDWRDISELSLRDGLYTIPFLYDYLLGFQRDNEKTVFYLVDTYSDVEDISGYALGSSWSAKVCGDYLDAIEHALAYGIPVYLLPQSFGPFDYQDEAGKAIDERTRRLLPQVKHIFAREQEGYDALISRYGLTNVTLTRDMVLASRIEDYSPAMRKKNAVEVPLLAENSVCVIPSFKIENTTDHTILQVYCPIIRECLEQGLTVYISHHSSLDIDLCRDLKAAFADEERVVLLEQDHSCMEFNELVKQFRFVISSRFHAIVHALKNGVPCIALGWATKYMDLMKLFGQEQYVFDLRDPLDADQTARAVARMTDRWQQESETIRAALPELQKENVFERI